MIRPSRRVGPESRNVPEGPGKGFRPCVAIASVRYSVKTVVKDVVEPLVRELVNISLNRHQPRPIKHSPQTRLTIGHLPNMPSKISPKVMPSTNCLSQRSQT